MVDLTANNIFRDHVSFLWKTPVKIHVKVDKLFSPREIRVAPSMFQKVFTSMTMFLNRAGTLLYIFQLETLSTSLPRTPKSCSMYVSRSSSVTGNVQILPSADRSVSVSDGGSLAPSNASFSQILSQTPSSPTLWSAILNLGEKMERMRNAE